MDLPQLREGQEVRVYQKVSDGKRERNVAFIGKLMKVRGIGINKMITVKQVLEGIEVEKIFPISSPAVIKIEIVEVVKKARKSKKSSGKKTPKKSRKTQGTSTKSKSST